MSASNYIHIQVDKIIRETDKALLVRLESGDEEWLPLSQMADPEDYQEGDEDVEIAVTNWWARQRNLL